MKNDQDPDMAFPPPHAGRRRLLQALSAAPVSRRLPAGVAGGALAALPVPAVLAATPSCDPPSSPTRAQTEGPYFTPNSPRRASLLEADVKGVRLVLTGRVLATDCTPVPSALLDFWQADADGNYDNRAYRLRGHQFADEQGRYRLETVLPGIYPGRTRHIHVRVQPRDGRLLTTQLYFPGEIRNDRDGIFSPALLVSVAPPDQGEPSAGQAPMAAAMSATFDFVLVRG